MSVIEAIPETKVRVECPCGARGKVAPQHLGRKIRCRRCRQPFEARACREERSPPRLTACPACCSPGHPDASRCLRCGFDRESGRGGRGLQRTAPAGPLPAAARELALPLGLALSALLIHVAATGTTGLVRWGFDALVVIAAAFVAGAVVFKTDFGPAGPALAKLSAAATFPSVLGGLTFAAIGGLAGALAGVLVAWGAWFGLLAWFFRMHFAASALLFGLCWLIRWAAVAALVSLLA